MPERGGPLLLGIDVGTQSARVGIFDLHGSLLASASRPYATVYPRPGWAEQDPEDWWAGICGAARDCLQQPGVDARRLSGLSFDATSSTVLLVGPDGRPLEPAILWMDQRAAEEVERISRTGHPILRYSGGQDSAEWMVPKGLWLKKHCRESYTRAHRLLEATDWIAYRLTGQWTVSQCNATCKWNYASVDGGWPESFFEALGARDLLAKWPGKVVPLGQGIGPLTREAAAALGLPPGIPVAEGGSAAHVGLLGLNALEPSKMGLITGSSNVMFVLADRPVFSPGLWGPYPEPILPGKWLMEAGQTSSGSIINWLVENFLAAAGSQIAGAPGEAKDGLLSRLEGEVLGLPPGSGGVVMLDYWQGNRTPRRDPRAKGAIFGLTLGHDYRHLVRSAYEAIAFGTRHILETYRAAGIDVRLAAAGGGGTRSRVWRQLTADVCGLPITIPRQADCSGVLGSAVCAACGAGLYGSLAEASAGMVTEERRIEPRGSAELYDKAYRTYLELYESTQPLL